MEFAESIHQSDVLIVGAGVAGLSAAACLSDSGLTSVIVEKNMFAGGRTADLACMATTACAKCGACLLEDVGPERPGAVSTLLTQTEIQSVRMTDNGVEVAAGQAALVLNSEACIACGLCYDVCPAKGEAIRHAPARTLGPRYGLFPEDCHYFRDGSCRACQDVCPVKAIDLDAAGRNVSIQAKAIILSVGYVPFDARLKPRFGYGRLPNVTTALELDRILRRTGDVRRPSDESPLKRIAFIQCVGSRDKKIGRDYCSRVCCGYALRLARLIRHRRPETAVTLFYMDLQNAGRNFDRFYEGAKEELELIQGIPGEIEAGPDGGVLVPVASGTTGRKETRSFDLVVLSVGLGPPDSKLADLFGLTVDRDGFPQADASRGVFLAGAAAGPAGVAESQTSGRAAAEQAAEFLKNK